MMFTKGLPKSVTEIIPIIIPKMNIKISLRFSILSFLHKVVPIQISNIDVA